MLHETQKPLLAPELGSRPAPAPQEFPIKQCFSLALQFGMTNTEKTLLHQQSYFHSRGGDEFAAMCMLTLLCKQPSIVSKFIPALGREEDGEEGGSTVLG